MKKILGKHGENISKYEVAGQTEVAPGSTLQPPTVSQEVSHSVKRPPATCPLRHHEWRVRYKRGYQDCYQERRPARQRTTFGLSALMSSLTGTVQNRNLDSKGPQSPGPQT